VVLAGIMAALSSGAGAAFAADYFDPALRTPEEALTYLELPVLASLPEGTGRSLSA
jgi:capsular polysaccharide biosynthesis protein